MKTLTTIFLALVISAGSAFAQPIKDKAVIPIGVTLNKISRLDITGGGAIEFIFNTIDHYRNGINHEATTGGSLSQYQTSLIVASSSDYTLNLSAEATTFTSQDGTGTALDIGELQYLVEHTGTAPAAPAVHEVTVTPEYNTAASAVSVTDGDVPIVEPGTTDGNAGNGEANAFTIHWIMGASGNLLGSTESGRHITNITLSLN